ncbi:hypothetical protein KEM55_000105 [Ascosphaera atra]|nr:hypothetical protein KEM55_000105 [Ascosphaera atra]
MEQYLRCYINFKQNDWPLWLDLAEISYNRSLHTTTRQTPFMLMYGYNPCFLEDNVPTEPRSQTPESRNGCNSCARTRRVRKVRGKKRIQYLMKWLGWPEEHNAWYDLQDLDNAKEALKDFETSLAAEKALSNSLPRRRRVVALHAKS